MHQQEHRFSLLRGSILCSPKMTADKLSALPLCNTWGSCYRRHGTYGDIATVCLLAAQGRQPGRKEQRLLPAAFKQSGLKATTKAGVWEVSQLRMQPKAAAKHSGFQGINEVTISPPDDASEKTQWGIFTTPRGALTKATSDPNLQNHWVFCLHRSGDGPCHSAGSATHVSVSLTRRQTVTEWKWRAKAHPCFYRRNNNTTNAINAAAELGRQIVCLSKTGSCLSTEAQQPAVPWKPSRRSWNGLFTSTWHAGALCRTAGESHAQKLCQGYWRT